MVPCAGTAGVPTGTVWAARGASDLGHASCNCSRQRAGRAHGRWNWSLALEMAAMAAARGEGDVSAAAIARFRAEVDDKMRVGDCWRRPGHCVA